MIQTLEIKKTTREKYLNLRASKEEFEMISNLAKSKGLSISDFIRQGINTLLLDESLDIAYQDKLDELQLLRM